MMRHFPTTIRALAIFAICVTLTTGCGRGGPKSVAVTGTVTYHGKPIDAASVLFISAKNRSSESKTDAEGRFTMESLVSDDGGKADEQIVCVTKTIPDPHSTKDEAYPRRISVLPTRYGTPLQSPLKVAISAKGPNDFCFELTD